VPFYRTMSSWLGSLGAKLQTITKDVGATLTKAVETEKSEFDTGMFGSHLCCLLCASSVCLRVLSCAMIFLVY
jgi:hypothetical protein